MIMNDLLRKLTEAAGPPGNESDVRSLIQEEVRQHADDIHVDVMGNLLVYRNGPGPRIMLSAHMDEIGVVVTHVDDKGFLRFGPLGRLNPLTLIGQRVILSRGTLGVIGTERRESESEEVKIEKLYIDVGVTDRESALRVVNVGDAGAFVREFHEAHGRYVAKALDDRVGCAILIRLLQDLRHTSNSLICAFTVQEEIGMRGASTSSFGVEPDLALAVDVTLTGDTPESPRMSVSLGKGPAIKVKDRGMLANPVVKNLLIDTAQRLNVPYQLEVLDQGTTDAAVIQVSRAGVLTGAVSIPCRYVHTTSEMVDSGDLDGALKILKGIASERLQLPT